MKKMIIVLNVNEDAVNEDGLKYAIDQGFGPNVASVDRVIQTDFTDKDEFSLIDAALMDNYLDFEDAGYTKEQEVAIAKWIANSAVLTQAIGDCHDLAIEEVIGDVE